MKIREITTETATAGASASAGIATIANPNVSNPYLKTYKTKGRKKNKVTDNALDSDENLMGSGTIKR